MMLTIKRDFDRPIEHGQYFIELIKNRDKNFDDFDRLGYWCDRAHLRQIARSILIHFASDIINEALKKK